MPRKARVFYWDASVFLSLFQKGDDEQKKYQRKQAILLLEEIVTNGDIIVTSTLTIAEARRGEGQPPLPGDDHATLSAFFKHSYIEVVPVDRGIAEMAAQLGERFSLGPSDAVQLATAIHVKAPVFLAWDRHFHRASAMQGAPIAIEEPKWMGSRQLSLDESLAQVEDSEESQEKTVDEQTAP